MLKKFTVFQVVLIYLLLFCSFNFIKVNAYSNAWATPAEISKEDVIKLIKEQGNKDNYYLVHLSYQLTNVDNDDDLEIIAQTVGGVHLGDFFIFDKNMYDKYMLVMERPWKVEKLNFTDYPNLIGGIKLNEVIERTGGTGVDIYTAHLWYLKEDKVIEAWRGILKERSYFQGNYGLGVGGYQFIDDFYHLYTWLSDYSIEIKTNTPIRKPTTTVSIYRFNGTKFILESKGKCEHGQVFPNIQPRK